MNTILAIGIAIVGLLLVVSAILLRNWRQRKTKIFLLILGGFVISTALAIYTLDMIQMAWAILVALGVWLTFSGKLNEVLDYYYPLRQAAAKPHYHRSQETRRESNDTTSRLPLAPASVIKGK